MEDLFQLDTLDPETGSANVVIETPKGTRNKFKWDLKRRFFKLSNVLPAGSVFPFDFGFLPQTIGEDGDPLDVLVLMDEPAFAGCILTARLIGIIEAEQTEKDGKHVRNDRLIAVSDRSHTHGGIKAMKDLDDTFVTQIEHFFISYNEMEGKKFKPIGRHGVERARKFIEEGRKRAAGQK